MEIEEQKISDEEQKKKEEERKKKEKKLNKLIVKTWLSILMLLLLVSLISVLGILWLTDQTIKELLLSGEVASIALVAVPTLALWSYNIIESQQTLEQQQNDEIERQKDKEEEEERERNERIKKDNIIAFNQFIKTEEKINSSFTKILTEILEKDEIDIKSNPNDISYKHTAFYIQKSIEAFAKSIENLNKMYKELNKNNNITLVYNYLDYEKLFQYIAERMESDNDLVQNDIYQTLTVLLENALENKLFNSVEDVFNSYNKLSKISGLDFSEWYEKIEKTESIPLLYGVEFESCKFTLPLNNIEQQYFEGCGFKGCTFIIDQKLEKNTVLSFLNKYGTMFDITENYLEYIDLFKNCEIEVVVDKDTYKLDNTLNYVSEDMTDISTNTNLDFKEITKLQNVMDYNDEIKLQSYLFDEKMYEVISEFDAENGELTKQNIFEILNKKLFKNTGISNIKYSNQRLAETNVRISMSKDMKNDASFKNDNYSWIGYFTMPASGYFDKYPNIQYYVFVVKTQVQNNSDSKIQNPSHKYRCMIFTKEKLNQLIKEKTLGSKKIFFKLGDKQQLSIESVETKDSEKSMQKNNEDNSHNDNSDILYLTLEKNKVKATGKLLEDEKSFIVYKGSTLSEDTTESIGKNVKQLREKLETSIENNTLLTDVIFTSSSAAAVFLAGYSISGPRNWKNKKGQTLSEISEKIKSSQQEILKHTYKKHLILGRYVDKETFILLKGSYIDDDICADCSNTAKKLRIEHAKLIQNNKLTEDLEFTSSSAALAFATGLSISGPSSWKDDQDKTLKELKELKELD